MVQISRCNFDNDFWTESGPLFTELCHVIPSRLVVEEQARLHKLLQGLGLGVYELRRGAPGNSRGVLAESSLLATNAF